MIDIECPKCGRSGHLKSPSGKNANDDEDVGTMTSPEGFRKIQIGWNSSAVYLFCTDCSLAAIFSDRTERA